MKTKILLNILIGLLLMNIGGIAPCDATYCVPAEKWDAADIFTQVLTIENMGERFIKNHPSCLKGQAGFNEDEKTFNVLMRCIESAPKTL